MYKLKPYCYILLSRLPMIEGKLEEEDFKFFIFTDTLQIGHEILIKLEVALPSDLIKIRKFLKKEGFETYDIEVFFDKFGTKTLTER